MDVNNYIPSSTINSQAIDVILVFRALGKQPVVHRPELHRRQINSQTIIDVKNYITSDIINSGK